VRRNGLTAGVCCEDGFSNCRFQDTSEEDTAAAATAFFVGQGLYPLKGGRNMRLRRINGAVLFMAMCLLVAFGSVQQAQAQVKYPNRAIDIIVGFVPGGSTDLSTRIMADYLKKKWNVPVNVINKGGGNTIPAALEVYNAKPDGYTLFADSSSSNASLEIGTKDLPFKVMDRTFIGMHSMLPFVYVVHAPSSYKTFQDLIAEAKKDPEHFTWTSNGGVGFQDITFRQFCKAVGLDVTKTKPIVTRGAAESITLTAGGHVKMGGGSATSAMASLQAGTIRVLAVTSKERWPEIPNAPTTAELGYPSIDNHQWNGVSGPPKLPAPIVDIWEQTMQAMAKDPEVNARMKSVGTKINYLNSRQVRQYVEREREELKVLWGVK
jgi:tripartite-type tricarboxylate transporter receptor subunit TctC